MTPPAAAPASVARPEASTPPVVGRGGSSPQAGSVALPWPPDVPPPAYAPWGERDRRPALLVRSVSRWDRLVQGVAAAADVAHGWHVLAAVAHRITVAALRQGAAEREAGRAEVARLRGELREAWAREEEAWRVARLGWAALDRAAERLVAAEALLPRLRAAGTRRELAAEADELAAALAGRGGGR